MFHWVRGWQQWWWLPAAFALVWGLKLAAVVVIAAGGDPADGGTAAPGHQLWPLYTALAFELLLSALNGVLVEVG